MIQFFYSHFLIIIISGLALFLLSGLGIVLSLRAGRKGHAIFAALLLPVAIALFISPREIVASSLIALVQSGDTGVRLGPETALHSKQMLLDGLVSLYRLKRRGGSRYTDHEYEFTVCPARGARCYLVTFAQDSRDKELFWVHFDLETGRMPLGFLDARTSAYQWY